MWFINYKYTHVSIYDMNILIYFCIIVCVESKSLKFYVNSMDYKQTTTVETSWLYEMVERGIPIVEYNEESDIDRSKPFIIRKTEWNFNPYKYPCVDDTAIEIKLNASSGIVYEQKPIPMSCVPVGDPNGVMRGYWWNGNKRTVTKIHYDQSENIIWCDTGKKIWFIWEPEDRTNLYLPHLDSSGYKTEARYLFHTVDKKRYTRIKKTKMYSVVMRDKDVLYIPPKWPHTVYTLKQTFCISNWNLRRRKKNKV